MNYSRPITYFVSDLDLHTQNKDINFATELMITDVTRVVIDLKRNNKRFLKRSPCISVPGTDNSRVMRYTERCLHMYRYLSPVPAYMGNFGFSNNSV